LPLTESVSFTARLQKGNRVQVPRLIRWQFKLEPTQVLKVDIYPVGASFVTHENFFAKMGRDGRVTIPKLVVSLLRLKPKRTLEVGLKPAEAKEAEEELEENNEEE